MCDHQPAGRWGRIWTSYLFSILAGFFALEVTALAVEAASDGKPRTVDDPLTLTRYLRHVAGLAPACRHGGLGRTAIVGFFLWAAVHLGWGVLSLGMSRPRR